MNYSTTQIIASRKSAAAAIDRINQYLPDVTATVNADKPWMIDVTGPAILFTNAESFVRDVEAELQQAKIAAIEAADAAKPAPVVVDYATERQIDYIRALYYRDPAKAMDAGITSSTYDFAGMTKSEASEIIDYILIA